MCEKRVETGCDARWRRRIHPKSKSLSPKSKALASKNQSKAFNLLQRPQKSFFGSCIDTTLEELEETGKKMKCMRGILNDSPDELVDRSWSGRLPCHWSAVNAFEFLLFVSRLVIPHAFFYWNPQFFMPIAKEILIFGQNLTIYLSMCLYDAYDMKFMQSKGIFIKNSLSNH